MFKVAKASVGYKALQTELHEAGLREVGKIHLKKKGGETSNAMFFIKEKQANQKVSIVLRSHCRQFDPSNRFWENCKDFWGDTEIAKKAVLAQLNANTEK